MDLRQSQEFAEYLKSQGWTIEHTPGAVNHPGSGRMDSLAPIFIRKIPLTPFSIIKVQRPEKIDFAKINQLAKKYRALAIYLEPKFAVTPGVAAGTLPVWKNQGYHLSKSPYLPTKTIHLDLAQSEKQLLAQMKKDARYSLRKAQRSCKVVNNSPGVAEQRTKTPRGGGKNNLSTFHHAWKKSVSWQRHVPSQKSLISLKKSFGKNVIFLTASYSDTPVYRSKGGEAKTRSPSPGVGHSILAGTIILLTNTTAYYYYAFTSKKGRKKMAQYHLVWEAIKLVKKRGCQIFDFEGIYDPRFPIKTWQGFSHFKKSFGGKEVEYPGCFTKKRLPF
ncbi:lipid II:glycine glycyltransferase FemX [Patescibacteria group bacterium]